MFFFIDASAQDGGRAGRRAGALASMKKKRVFAGLDPKMSPRGVKNFSFDVSPVSSHRHAVAAIRKSLMS